MKSEGLVTLKIEEVNSYGCGVAHGSDGRVMFVNGAIGGDVITAAVIKKEKSYSVCRLISVDEPSPYRTDKQFCGAPNACGGCTYRHMSYSYELTVKRGMVEDAMRRAGIISSVSIADTVPTGGEDGGYRNKVIYPVCGVKGGLRYGYYATGTHKAIPYADCALTHPIMSPIAKRAIALAERFGVSAYNEESGKGLLRDLYMRCSETYGEVLVCFVINGKALPCESEIASLLSSEFPCISGILVNVNEKKTNVVLGREYRVLFGKDYIKDMLLGKEFIIRAPAFWQVNRRGAEILYSKGFELAGISDGDVIVDLYCGIGSIGIAASDRASAIYGIEIVEDAVKCATENAQINGIQSASYICADAAGSEAAIRKVFTEHPDALCIVDPPRKGCGKELMLLLAELNVKKVLYISCNPYSLAQDMSHLLANGYEPSEVFPVDMFPRTGHVETIVLLSRKKVNDRINFDINIEALPDRVSKTATYAEIKAYVLEHYGLKVSSLYIAQIKDKHGIKERENYNIGEGKSKELICPPEKEEAITNALKHFNMI